MSSLAEREERGDRLRLHGAGLLGLWAALGIAGAILAQRYGFRAAVAVPVVAAFCWQAALYWMAACASVRKRIEEALSAPALAAALVAASLAPYAIYAWPTGRFSWSALMQLALLCACVAVPYVAFPVRGRRFAWQDALVICALAYPMISGLSSLFRDIYVGFEPPAHRLDALGKLMLIPLGLFAFLSLRRLPGVGFRLVPRRADWRPALESLAFGLPWLALVGLGTGFLRWSPPTLETALPAFGSALGKLLGIYCTTALAEEFLLRGVVQNLAAASTGRPLLARGLAAVLFGASHLGRGAFPNLPYAASAAVLGWFCGRAYDRARSVTAAMIAHALAVAAQTLFFG